MLLLDEKITEFFCTTKVTGIKTSKRWCYIGCSKCTKRFQREISSFTCVLCDMWVS
ncbi:BnaC06g24510D [Brassica napus]|uniref:BnaC06g24510D protein n=2 Tax=Brassica TaxID=3705 RepID=A0A078GEE2_BRANA|nr:BnaC06g24510D [Brassica napus]